MRLAAAERPPEEEAMNARTQISDSTYAALRGKAGHQAMLQP